MSTSHLIRKEELPELLTGAKAPIWWAMVVLVTIETTVFATLISSYFYLRFTTPEWPPVGIPEPDLFLPIVNTVVLFASSVAVYIGSSGIKKGKIKRLKWGVGIGILLEIVFFAIKIVLSLQTPYGWTDHAYGSIFFTISRLHTLHVLAAILMASVAWVLAMRGYFTEERRLGIQAINIYWQFVAVIWIPVFVVLFLVPRWL